MMSLTQTTAHFQKLQTDFGVSDSALANLLAFKKAEDKNDPTRRMGIHGPYEQMHIVKHGALPADYYSGNPPTLWGLRIEESRSNIIWQVTMGVLDHQPEFAAAYLGLALDKGIDGADYARELFTLHQDFTKYLKAPHHGHHHHHAAHVFNSISCTACSVVTSLAIRDNGFFGIFKEMQGFAKGEDRRQFLEEKGLLAFMLTTIEDLQAAQATSPTITL
jgi:hypothetical protein